jgi:U3 small nucleolar RNA-associated protein 7
VIPGAGEPNFDSFVANPFITTKQRREEEVHQLLDKLPPETIMLNPDTIGGIKVRAGEREREREREQSRAERERESRAEQSRAERERERAERR